MLSRKIQGPQSSFRGLLLCVSRVGWVVVRASTGLSAGRTSLEQRLACDDVAAFTARSMDSEKNALDLATPATYEREGSWSLCGS
jgi:hypothetical protein